MTDEGHYIVKLDGKETMVWHNGGHFGGSYWLIWQGIDKEKYWSEPVHDNTVLGMIIEQAKPKPMTNNDWKRLKETRYIL